MRADNLPTINIVAAIFFYAIYDHGIALIVPPLSLPRAGDGLILVNCRANCPSGPQA
jgi:hypothetical protein